MFAFIMRVVFFAIFLLIELLFLRDLNKQVNNIENIYVMYLISSYLGIMVSGVCAGYILCDSFEVLFKLIV